MSCVFCAITKRVDEQEQKLEGKLQETIAAGFVLGVTAAKSKKFDDFVRDNACPTHYEAVCQHLLAAQKNLGELL